MRKWLSWIGVLVLLVGCAGCQDTAAAEEGAATQQTPIVRDSGQVIAEGTVVPAQWSGLVFESGGQVVDILVAAGDQVQAGDPLLRLDDEAAVLALQVAEQDLAAQAAVLAQLRAGPGAAVTERADREHAEHVAQAEVIVQIKELALEKARLESGDPGVAIARSRVEQQRRQVEATRAQDPDPQVAAAQVTVERAQIAAAEAQDEYNKALDRPWEPQVVRDDWAKRLRQAQLDVRLAQSQLEEAQGAKRAHIVQLAILDAQVAEGQALLEQALAAQEAYSMTLEMLAAEIEAARLDLAALRAWENPYRDPPAAEALAQAEAMVKVAEAGVAQARLAVERLALKAPFAGAVVEVLVEERDMAAPGQTVLVLVGLDRLQVETIDLTELDVTRIAVGQPVLVRADALPGQTFGGQVIEIGRRGHDYRGDVVYPVTVALEEPEAQALLFWGMTAVVEIEVR